MLQNTRVTAFTVSELLRKNQQGGKKGVGGKITPHPPRLGLNHINQFHCKSKCMLMTLATFNKFFSFP